MPVSERDPNLIVRVARKAWTCAAREHHVDCGVTIRPGSIYVEYVGEAPAYQAGTRYSLTCAREAFGDIEVPTCSHGVQRGGVCADCREERTGVPARDDDDAKEDGHEAG